MATSRSGAGGKIVTNRRNQRVAATPYDRPPPQSSPPPPPKSPNWFTGIIVPSARALASGAGKVLSSIFSESEPSSFEDEEYASDDDIDNDNHNEIPYNGVNTLVEKNATSSEHREESQLMWSRETKRIIEQLIMKETFSREERDKLIRILHSRVMDRSMQAGEKSSVAGSPVNTVDHEDVDKAVQEAKRWFQGKKVEPNSLTELTQEVETGGGSPVDVARTYMKERSPWASPQGNVELRTPLTATMKLFKEGTLNWVGDYSSSSKNRSSLASGSWNIQEELRRVCSKATDGMLQSPSTNSDPSLFAVARTRMDSAEAGEKVFAMGERITQPMSLILSQPINALVDAGVSSDPALAAFDSRQDGKASEALPLKPAASVSENNEVLEAVLVESECPAPKPIQPNHAEERHTDMSKANANGSPSTKVTEFGGEKIINGLSSSQVSLSAGIAMRKNYKQYDDENQMGDTSNEKPTNIINREGNCELLSEAYMEVPIVTETNSIAGGSQNSMAVHYKELSVDMAQASPEENAHVVAGKQRGIGPSKYTRKRRGRGK